MSEELKPCPFCGSTDPIIHHIEPHKHPISGLPDYEGGCTIECSGCDLGFIKPTEAEAVSAWNRRAQPERKLTDERAAFDKWHIKYGPGFTTYSSFNSIEISAAWSAWQARAILAAQPAAATVPDLASELLLAVIGLKRVIELAVTKPDGSQYSYLETRNKSFVHVVTALEMAEAVIAKCATQPPAAQAQDGGGHEQCN